MSLPHSSRLRRAVLASLALSATALLVPAAQAADPWPGKPIQLVIPYPPGGSADLLALTWLLHFATTEGNINE